MCFVIDTIESIPPDFVKLGGSTGYGKFAQAVHGPINTSLSEKQGNVRNFCEMGLRKP